MIQKFYGRKKVINSMGSATTQQEIDNQDNMACLIVAAVFFQIRFKSKLRQMF